MRSIVPDFRYALRSLQRAPGFTLIAVLTLALGIGANVAMFGIVDAVLLKGLPYPEEERLVLGRTLWEGYGVGWNVSAEDYYDYRDQVEAFQSLGAIRTEVTDVTVTGGEEPERVPSTLVSTNLFSTLRVDPQQGRHFADSDADLSNPATALISHSYWQRRFGGDRDALGSIITVDGSPTTIVGIVPADFFFFQNVDLWFPLKPGGPWTGPRRFHNWTLVGRLAEGMTLEEAQSQVNVVSRRLQEAYPESNAAKGLDVSPLQSVLVDSYDEMLMILMATIALVLLIACGNVAGLLLARGSGRAREFSVRLALGATGGRLARQLLGESILLSGAAAVLGILMALWLQDLALEAIPLDYNGITELGLSGTMLAFASILSLATALFFGITPAWAGARADPGKNLASGTRTTEKGTGGRVRSGLVTLQVALSLVLLIGSGLLVRSFMMLQAVDPGFQTEGIFTARIGLPSSEYSEERDRIAFFTGFLDDIQNLPGVQSAGVVSLLPIKDTNSNVGAWNPEIPPQSSNDVILAEQRKVLPGYFETMGIPVMHGRDFRDPSEGESELVSILNRTMARALFGNADPVGRMVAVDVGGDEPSLARVVGVVGDVHMVGLAVEPQRQMYFSYERRPPETMSLAVRTAGNPGAVTTGIRDLLRARDPDVPLGSIATMDEVVRDAVATPRVLMLSLAGFAFVALFLSALGLYGLLAFYVVRRIPEIGIRVALGASPGRVIKLILQRGLILVGIGLALGLGGAYLLTRFLQEQLFQVEALDPMTFGLGSVALILVATLACLIPAWRAVRVDPIRALQGD